MPANLLTGTWLNYNETLEKTNFILG